MTGEGTIAYRPGTPQDGTAMLSIHIRAIELVAVSDYGEELARSWAYGLTAERYGRSVADGETFEVAVIDERVVGFCSRKNNEVIGLYVDPDFMRRGIGSALLDRAMHQLRQQGHRRIIVDSSLTAMPFYLRHGFHLVSERIRPTRGGLDIRAVDLEWYAPQSADVG